MYQQPTYPPVGQYGHQPLPQQYGGSQVPTQQMDRMALGPPSSGHGVSGTSHSGPPPSSHYAQGQSYPPPTGPSKHQAPPTVYPGPSQQGYPTGPPLPGQPANSSVAPSPYGRDMPPSSQPTSMGPPPPTQNGPHSAYAPPTANYAPGAGMGPPLTSGSVGPPAPSRTEPPPSLQMGPASFGGMGPPPGGSMGHPPGGAMPPPSSGPMGPPAGHPMGAPSSGSMGPPAGGPMGLPSSGMMVPPSSGMMVPPSSGMMVPPFSGMMVPPSSGMMVPPSSGMMVPPSSGVMGLPPGGPMGPLPGASMGPPPGGPMGRPPSGAMGPPPGGPMGPSSSGAMGFPPGGPMGPPGVPMGPPAGGAMGPPGGPMGPSPGGFGGPASGGFGMGGRPDVHPSGALGPMGGPPGPGGISAGPIQSQPSRQPAARIDPDMMPNPIAVMRENQLKKGGDVPFRTSTRGVAPPMSSTSFTVQDDGNSSPRFMRATLYTVPCTKDLLNQCRLPLGLIIQPFANLPLNENNLYVVDHGAGGPIRCKRCKAYMSVYARFVDGGRQYICPICQCSNEVSPEYFSHIDHTGRRTDILQRPELMYGTVEYVATKDYCKDGVLPGVPAYIFMLDVSLGNQQSGMVNLLSQTMLNILESLPGSESGNSPIKVGFVTYDKVLHFYNVKETLAQPQMMVMTDVSDVFVPMVDGFLVSLTDARAVVENLMSMLPQMFSANKTQDVVLEPVIRAGMEVFKAASCNGRLFIFHSNLPTVPGSGQLKNRLDTKLLGTDKEKNLLTSGNSAYQKLAEECVKYGVGVELFLFPSGYCDVATLSSFATTTGGDVHYFPHYQTPVDGDRLLEQVKSSVSRPTVFDAVMRVRCSSGIRAVNFYGGFHMANTTDVELGNMDSDKTVAVEIKHDDKIKEDELAYVQVAILYTNLHGHRRLRIHNLAMNCSNKMQDIFHSCESDAIIAFFSKSIAKASMSMPYKTIRENFTHQCAVILSCYRKHCSSHSPVGQLILPDTLKLLPMYANCVLKNDALLSPPIVSLDEKCWLLYRLLSMNILQLVPFLYPQMISLHDVHVEEKDVPQPLRSTGTKIVDSGLYVIDNGLVMVLWVGQQLPPDLVTKLFGVSSHAQIDNNMHALPALDNPISFRVRGIINGLRAKRQCYMKLVISKQRDKSEIFFRRMLKEDKGTGPWEGTSYIDYLCQLHREIREILS